MPSNIVASSLFCVTLAGIVAASPASRAQDNSAAVEQLFDDGKRLMASGQVAEACPKFLASYNLENRVGTLLNLADCYERNKQYASAWARFIEARTLATRNHQDARADFANQHAAALEPKRSMLTIVADQGVAGLVVERDGAVVSPAVYGVPVPVDGGPHTIQVSAPGKLGRTEKLTLADEGEAKTYTVAPLADAAATPAQSSAPPATPEVAPSGRGSARVIAGLAIAGAGVVAAGVGAIFGVTALSKNSDSSPYCGVGGQKDNCFGPGVALRSDAVSDATLSSVLLGVGAVAIAGGLVLWLTAPSSKTQATVGFDGRTLRIAGTF